MKLPTSIKDIHKGFKNKEYSCLELTKLYLDRIENLDSDLNSYITVSETQAKGAAQRVDKLLDEMGDRAFEMHPLLGVPMGHKDLFLTKGLLTTAASKILADFVPEYSSTVVDKINSAGAVVLGKLNCDAWAHGSSGENSDFGSTKNPWNKEYVSGGSSSGSGAAVAAGLAHFATATDTCGSTRLPANFCGVVGFKPTYGAVSRYGIVAMASSLDSIGHIAKTVDDAKNIFKVTKGIDVLDSTTSKGKKSVNNKNIKIGIPKEFFGSGLSSDVENKIEEVINIFKKSGIDFVEINLPHTKYAISAYYIIQPAEVSSNLSRYSGVRYGNDRDKFGEEAKRRIMLGTYVLSSGYRAEYYLKAMKVRAVIIDELAKVFEKVDAIIAPVAASPAFKLGEKTQDPLKMYLTDIYAATANLTGTPALAIPYGKSKNNLPLGFQLMGPRFSENLLFELGEKFEMLTEYSPSSPI